jgi:acyl-coenzyme A synthetase/AMP-(fatty) acid ligase/acyl carrier protein
MAKRLFKLDDNKPHDFGGPTGRPFEALEELADTIPLHQLIERHAVGLGDKPAVVTVSATLTFGELVASAHRFATAFLPVMSRESGVKPVFCLSDDSCVQVAVALACWRLGLAHAPLDPDMTGRRMAGILRAQAGAILVGSRVQVSGFGDIFPGLHVIDADLDAVSPIDPVPDFSSPDAAGSIIFTSGSTGEPKGIVHGQHSLALQMAAKVRNGHLNDRDCAAYVGAVFVAGWQRNALPLLAVGATALFLAPKTSAERILELNQAYCVTVFGSYVGTARLLARHALAVNAFAGIRMLTMFGDALSLKDVQTMRAILPEDALICSSYSQSEHWRISSWFLDETLCRSGERIPVGYPSPDSRVALLVDDQDRTSGDQPAGEVVVASPLLAKASWPDPVAFNERLVADPDDSTQTFFRTGDVLRLREDGMLVFVGRVDNQVKINGWRIEPEEVERAAQQHPLVDMVACHARRDESGRAERLVLYAVPAAGSEHLAVDLLEHLRQRLPEYMVPSEVLEVGALPLMPTGKVDRRALAAQDAVRLSNADEGAAGASLQDLWPDPRQCAVAALIAKEVRQTVISPDQSLIDVFGDSLEALTIALEIEKQFGVSLDPTELLTDEPLGPIVARICQD